MTTRRKLRPPTTTLKCPRCGAPCEWVPRNSPGGPDLGCTAVRDCGWHLPERDGHLNGP